MDEYINCHKKSMLQLKMLILPFTENTSEKAVAESLRILKDGGIVAYPTESFYALGVLATDENAVKKLFKLKKRPAEKPLPVIVGDMDTLLSVVKNIPSQAKDLMKRFWPGQLTMIFNALDNIPELLTAGSQNIAVRIPGDSFALNLARASKFPVTATSANPSGLPPAKDAEAVKNYFGDNINLIIDAGKTPGGKPSTIVDITVVPPRILRQGKIILDEI
jgi:L-threonylcarbamoyladenylate synthase